MTDFFEMPDHAHVKQQVFARIEKRGQRIRLAMGAGKGFLLVMICVAGVFAGNIGVGDADDFEFNMGPFAYGPANLMEVNYDGNFI
ncbi:MAG: hypothetical protein FWF01_03655 [Alphaproteobacteria bacterium]|nr:hypothetical protein [Alphaproteobacteria bacterium]